MKYTDCETVVLKCNCEWKTIDWITNFYQLQICMEIFENSLLKLEGENEGVGRCMSSLLLELRDLTWGVWWKRGFILTSFILCFYKLFQISNCLGKKATLTLQTSGLPGSFSRLRDVLVLQMRRRDVVCGNCRELIHTKHTHDWRLQV